MKQLLIVEDDIDCLVFYESILDDYYEITSAEDKLTALKLMASRTFDVILADWMLPDGNGVEILTRVYQEGIFGVLITGFDTKSIDTQGRFTILHKPVHADQLIAWVENAEARTELYRSMNCYKGQVRGEVTA